MELTEAQCALLTLQRRAARVADCYKLDVLERAMDEIVRNPDNPKPAEWQVRSALANASKIIKQRRQLTSLSVLDAEADTASELVDQLDMYEETLCREWLRMADGLTDLDRRLLLALYHGFDAVMIAAADKKPVERIREQTSRARRKARARYEHSLVA